MPNENNSKYLVKNFEKYQKLISSITNTEVKNILSQIVSEYEMFIMFTLGGNDKITAAEELFLQSSPIAFKQLVKFAKYVDTNTDEIDLAKNIQILRQLLVDFRQMDVEKIADTYAKMFSDKDWEDAYNYFSKNPTEVYAGSANNLMYSYIKTADGISRRSKTLGEGGFGRTKSGDNSAEDQSASAIKRQKVRSYSYWSINKKQSKARELIEEAKAYCESIRASGGTKDPHYQKLLTLIFYTQENIDLYYEQILEELLWLPEVEQEAAFNLDLGVATGGLLVRRDDDDRIYKVYQKMHKFGPNLFEYLVANNPSEDERVDLSIKLLLLTNELHTGKLSLSGKPYAHLDIKLENILVDSSGNLHFIDFGLSKDENLDEKHFSTFGTKNYMPISFDPNNLTEATKLIDARMVDETPSYFFDDKIAAQRNIFHQVYKSGILSKFYWRQMPGYILDIINTHSISACIANDANYTLEYIAAVLISYEYTNHCSEDFVTNLVGSVDEQRRIISEFQTAKQLIKGLDYEGIKEKVLAGELSLDYLPDGYRLNANIKPEFLEFLINNDILTSQELNIVAKNLHEIILDNIVSPSFLRSIINNSDFVNIYLQNIDQADFDRTFTLIDIANLMTQNEWNLLCMGCLLQNRHSPIIFKNSDLSTVFLNLVGLSLYPNELNKSDLVQLLCQNLIGNDPDFELSLSEAKNVLEKVNNRFLALNFESVDPKFLIVMEQLDLIRAKVISSLEIEPVDFDSSDYKSAKELFAMYVLLQENIQAHLNGRLTLKQLQNFLKAMSSQFADVIASTQEIKQAFGDIQVITNSLSQAKNAEVSRLGLFAVDSDAETDDESIDSSLDSDSSLKKQ